MQGATAMNDDRRRDLRPSDAPRCGSTACWQPYAGPVTVTGDGPDTVGTVVDVSASRPTVRSRRTCPDRHDGADRLRHRRHRPGEGRRPGPPDVDWTATDAASGVDTVTAAWTVQRSRAVCSSSWRLPLGRHTLTVTATARAGNSATTSVTFTTETSIADLRRLVEQFADDGNLGPKVEKRLLEHLSVAARWIAEGKDGKAIERPGPSAMTLRTSATTPYGSAPKRDASWLIQSLQ